jgi:hypothetical protein
MVPFDQVDQILRVEENPAQVHSGALVGSSQQNRSTHPFNW